ncbi:hypothetical protein PM082_007557 [Marasmius tenuissimus]|nr:hypothetical protein PM082_007557 [Marasmius tenuissimus]
MQMHRWQYQLPHAIGNTTAHISPEALQIDTGRSRHSSGRRKGHIFTLPEIGRSSSGFPQASSIDVSSVRTAKATWGYFVNGTLPKEGTVCSMLGSSFDDPRMQ